MDWGQYIGILLGALVTVGTAYLGYHLTHRENVRRDRRRVQMERVSRQLAELYGPLYALTAAQDRAYKTYLKKHLVPDESELNEAELEARSKANREALSEADRAALSEADREAWKAWIRGVFMPTNDRITQVLAEKADLLEGEEIPEPFLELVGHAVGFNMLIKRWDAGDESQLRPESRYPADACSTAWTEFAKVKRVQNGLLGMERSGRLIDGKYKE